MSKYIKARAKPDFRVALVAICLSLFGLVMISSASNVIAYDHSQSLNIFVVKQAIALGIGIFLMLFFSAIDYRSYRKIAFPLMIITLVMLLAVFMPVIGGAAKGANRWINLGFTKFQPSEFAKISFILYLSVWLESKSETINSFKKSFLPFLAMLAVIAGLIIMQPDLGTLTVLISSAAVVFFVAGAPVWQFGSMLGFLALAFGVFIRAEPYRWSRFLTFMNPSSETLGAGYHINQAFIAVSQGGLLGLGFGKSIQKMEYLPEPHTDSIFAIICEELGFLRASLVIIAFIYFFYLGMKIARNAPDTLGRLLATGITASLTLQALINIAAMLGMVPLTGVTLPFISYGGSSLAMSLLQIGILLSISRVSNEYAKS
jgi:cell division protein FtsW